MPRWIVMNIIQARQIRSLECNVAIPKLKPYLPPWCVVPEIELFSGLHVKLTQQFPQRLGSRRRGSNEVIMICQHRPSAQFPAELGRASEQRFQKEIQSQS